MILSLYKLTCPLNKVGKTFDNQTAVTLSSVHLINSEDVVTPSFLLSENYDGYNYAVCDSSFGGRKYFLSPPVKVGQLYQYQLTLDAVETYKTDVLTQQAILERQQNNADGYLLDENWQVSTKHTTITKLFPNSLGDTTSTILTVLGGV